MLEFHIDIGANQPAWMKMAEHIEGWESSGNGVTIVSGNGLSAVYAAPLPEPILTYFPLDSLEQR